MSKLCAAIQMLIAGVPLPPQYKDHPLTGDWKHFRDCHIEPDWVLVYKVDGNDLYLVQTGTQRICSIEAEYHMCSQQARWLL